MQSAKLNWRQILFAGLLIGSLFCSPVVTLFAGILFIRPSAIRFRSGARRLRKIAAILRRRTGIRHELPRIAGRRARRHDLHGGFGSHGNDRRRSAGTPAAHRPQKQLPISSGTAICGGSAIAAVAPVIDADENQTSLSLATIFILNAVALFVFPVIGHWLGMGQTQFGTWAAIAIHDTSSVVGAGAAYGEEALKVATTVKLTRALWIIPVAGVGPIFRQKGKKIQIPGSSSGSSLPCS